MSELSYSEISQDIQNEVYAGARAFVQATKVDINVADISILEKDRISDSFGQN